MRPETVKGEPHGQAERAGSAAASAGISNEEQDTLLTALLEDAEQYALGYTGRSVLPAALEGAALELAILRYRRRGMEGETVHGEGGLQTTMEGLPSALEKLLNRYRRAKVV